MFSLFALSQQIHQNMASHSCEMPHSHGPACRSVHLLCPMTHQCQWTYASPSHVPHVRFTLASLCRPHLVMLCHTLQSPELPVPCLDLKYEPSCNQARAHGPHAPAGSLAALCRTRAGPVPTPRCQCPATPGTHHTGWTWNTLQSSASTQPTCTGLEP